MTAKHILKRPSIRGGSQRRFCSSLAWATIARGPKTFMCTLDAAAIAPPDPAIVPIISAASVTPSPAPPYASGREIPSHPPAATAS